LRDPSEEEALLVLLHDVITPQHAVVTFNGRNFDIPLLATRYLLSRQQTYLGTLANVDLLHPSRRLWQRRLPSCALSALEGDILGIQRTHADVPGSLIPYLYQQYLQSGDGGDMARVFYHNEQDILSMVVLAVILTRTFSRPDMTALPVEDRLSLARWYEHQSMLPESESAYRSALEDAPDAALRHAALTSFAAMLKQLNRREEAVPLWEYLADLKMDIAGHEELAKYYEWRANDLARAVEWTANGIALAESWRPGIRRVEALAALVHRQARLIRKLSGTATSNDAAEESLTANPIAGDES
jgi:tetratricopeptide (TPR) repeat protein